MAILKLDFTPDEDIRDGLVIHSDKLKTETTEDWASTNLKKGQRDYKLPKGIKLKDITKFYTNEKPIKHSP